MGSSIQEKNKALHALEKQEEKPEKFIFSKLGNELTLITTKICNLDCSFCYDKANLSEEEKVKEYREKELDSEEIVRLINIVKELGVNHIRLTGGEAILKEGFFDILKACEDMQVALCSNGLVLREKLDKIHNIHPKDLHIHLSLDGLKSHKKYRGKSDPYDLLDLAEYIKEEYPETKVSINTVLTKENIKELSELYHHLKETDIDRWTVSFPRMVENALEKGFKLPNAEEISESFIPLIKKYHKDGKPFNFTFSYFYKFELLENEFKSPEINLRSHPCLPDASGSKGLIVDSFGNILDCLVLEPFLEEPVNIKESLKEGNCSPETLLSKIESSLSSKFYDLKLEDKEECLDCRYLKLCKGGCPANAYYTEGSLNDIDGISCLMHYKFEDKILPELPKEERKAFKKLIRDTESKVEMKNRIEKRRKVLGQIGLLS